MKRLDTWLIFSGDRYLQWREVGSAKTKTAAKGGMDQLRREHRRRYPDAGPTSWMIARVGAVVIGRGLR